jgi:hypothetical protein
MTNHDHHDRARDGDDSPEIPRGDSLDALLRAWHDENAASARAKRDEIMRSLLAERTAQRAPAPARTTGVLAQIGFARLAVAALLLLATGVFVTMLVGPVGTREAVADDGIIQVAEGGALEAIDRDGNPLGACPLQRTEVSVEISGPFARTVVEQTYANPFPRTIEAVYTFPLSNRAAVDRMTMTVRGPSGDKVVEGEVKERALARAIYEDARESGFVASLLEQERPNIFTQSVANIEPGATVKVRIATIELVERKDGVSQYAFPMVVGPRYIPGRSSLAGDAMPRLPEGWAVREGLVLRGPAAAETEPGAAISSARLSRMLVEAIPVRATDAAAIDAMLAFGDGVPFLARYADGGGERGVFSPTASIGEINGRFFFVPAAPQGGAGTGFANPTDEVPDADKITPVPVRPETRAGHDISVTVTIDSGGAPLGAVASAEHAVRVEDLSPTRRVVSLADGKTIPNRDFVLRWQSPAATVEPAFFAHTSDAADADARGGFFALMLEPPARVEPSAKRPRELVFVLDVSGSMNGFPIEKSKELARKAIARMRPTDTFNIVTFAGATAVLWPEPKPATAENIAFADGFLAGASGGGGTEMMTAINAALVQPGRSGVDAAKLLELPADGRSMTVAVPADALAVDGARWRIDAGLAADGARRTVAAEIPVVLPENPRRLAVLLDGAWTTKDAERVFVARSARFEDADARTRFVFFLTDGYIGNDQAVVQAVRDNARASRVFSLGIGNSVNRFLLDEMARAGRGVCEVVTLAEDADAAVERLVRRIDAPVLTDLEIAVDPALGIRELLPAGDHLPDLYDVEPLVLIGRFDGAARGAITLRGRTGAGPWERTVSVELPAREPRHDVVPSLWARAKVDALLLPHLAAVESDTLDPVTRRSVIRLGEAFRISTPFTSFVAVEKSRVVVGGKPLLVAVPVELPSGTNWNGFFGTGAEVPAAMRAEARGVRGEQGAVASFGAAFARIAGERGLGDGAANEFEPRGTGGAIGAPPMDAPIAPAVSASPVPPPGSAVRLGGGGGSTGREILRKDELSRRDGSFDAANRGPQSPQGAQARRQPSERAIEGQSGELKGLTGRRTSTNAPIARPGAGARSGAMPGGGSMERGERSRPTAPPPPPEPAAAGEALAFEAAQAPALSQAEQGAASDRVDGSWPAPLADSAARDALVRVLERRLVILALAVLFGEEARVTPLAAELDLPLTDGMLMLAMKVKAERGAPSAEALEAIRAAGGRVVAEDASRGLLVAEVPPAGLAALGGSAGVLRVEPLAARVASEG